MAGNVLASNSTGNFTSAATWSLIDATSFSNSKALTKTTSTAFVSSAAFTPGVITIDAIAVYIAQRIANPTGTFTIQLFNVALATAVTGTTVTINVSDIDAAVATVGMGWYSLKLAAPVTLLVGTSYTLQTKTSTSAAVTLYTSATVNDWSRFLRTTTTQAPVAGDTTLHQGDWTAAATLSSYAITMNSTSLATTYGPFEVSKGAAFNYGIAASTNYAFSFQGDAQIWSSGIFTKGTLANPIPTTSTAKLQFASTAAVNTGIIVNSMGVYTEYTAPLTNDRALLAADASATATSLTTNISTGWKNGDVIAIASTTRTAGESESKALGADASGTSLPTIAALTNAHSGTAPTQGELINLTRRSQTFGIDNTNTGYIDCLNTSQVSLQGVEFFNLGSSTAGKRGIDLGTTTVGSAVIRSCSLHDFAAATTSFGINLNAAGNTNITLDSNVSYNINGSHIVNSAVSSTGLNQVITNNLGIKTISASVIFSITNLKITFQNNTAAGSASSGMTLSDTTYDGTGIISGLVSHSNATAGFAMSSLNNLNESMTTWSNFTAWRNTTLGFSGASLDGISIDGMTAFGNATANFGSAGIIQSCIFNNFTSTPGTTLTCPVGINISTNAPLINTVFQNSAIGAHSTGDINFAGAAYADFLLSNTATSSTTLIANQANMMNGAQVRFQRVNGTAGNHKTVKHFGVIIPDATLFNVSTPSTRMTPNSATQKFKSSPIKITVQSGQTATITAYIRKSVVGDGTAYNGNQPRVMLKANASLGYTSDTALITADNNANGAFFQYSATITAPTDNAVVEMYVDCDGTTGWINFDDVKVTTATANDQGSEKYWDNGAVSNNLASKTSGALIAGGVIL